MSGPNAMLLKNFVAGAAITKRRIVKFGGADNTVVQAAAATDAMIGVAAELDAAIGDRIDVHVIGLVEVEFGDTIARGGPVTADAQGRAVPATLAAGSVVRVIGHAFVSGVVGDVGVVMLAPTASVGTLDALVGGFTGTAVMTVNAAVGNDITVNIQLKDGAGDDLAERALVRAYLSDDANGDSIAATAPDTVAGGTDGVYIPLVAGKRFDLVSEADGDIDLVITEDGADTWYLVIALPTGALVVSDAITFE